MCSHSTALWLEFHSFLPAPLSPPLSPAASPSLTILSRETGRCSSLAPWGHCQTRPGFHVQLPRLSSSEWHMLGSEPIGATERHNMEYGSVVGGGGGHKKDFWLRRKHELDCGSDQWKKTTHKSLLFWLAIERSMFHIAKGSRLLLQKRWVRNDCCKAGIKYSVLVPPSVFSEKSFPGRCNDFIRNTHYIPTPTLRMGLCPKLLGQATHVPSHRRRQRPRLDEHPFDLPSLDTTGRQNDCSFVCSEYWSSENCRQESITTV